MHSLRLEHSIIFFFVMSSLFVSFSGNSGIYLPSWQGSILFPLDHHYFPRKNEFYRSAQSPSFAQCYLSLWKGINSFCTIFPGKSSSVASSFHLIITIFPEKTNSVAVHSLHLEHSVIFLKWDINLPDIHDLSFLTRKQNCKDLCSY